VEALAPEEQTSSGKYFWQLGGLNFLGFCPPDSADLIFQLNFPADGIVTPDGDVRDVDTITRLIP
jgi:hypothetical protein